jgi:heptaprenyl diphosphate synthase
VTLALPEVSAGLQDRLTDGLARVEALIEERIDHEDAFIAEANVHLLRAGGKRFRPMLTILASELGEGVNDAVVTAAAAVELTHLASLYHDDVMDEAELRRGTPTANTAYGNSTAILIGDLLFGHASALVAELGAEAVRIQAETFIRLCTGQIRDDRQPPEGEEAGAHYLRVLEDKTGVLIATAARYGAMFSGCDPDVIETMRVYGERLGMAFQLADDLIDIESSEQELGKLPGMDLREGKRTLAVSHALASTDPQDARLQQLLRSDLSGDTDLAEALGLLRAHPALARAREETRAVGVQAQEAIAALPGSEAKTALLALATSVTHRVS